MQVASLCRYLVTGSRLAGPPVFGVPHRLCASDEINPSCISFCHRVVSHFESPAPRFLRDLWGPATSSLLLGLAPLSSCRSPLVLVIFVAAMPPTFFRRKAKRCRVWLGTKSVSKIREVTGIPRHNLYEANLLDDQLHKLNVYPPGCRATGLAQARHRHARPRLSRAGPDTPWRRRWTRPHAQLHVPRSAGSSFSALPTLPQSLRARRFRRPLLPLQSSSDKGDEAVAHHHYHHHPLLHYPTSFVSSSARPMPPSLSPRIAKGSGGLS